MTSSEELKQRRLLAEITVVAFIAVAFHESLNTFRESLDRPGFPLEALEVFAIFFLTAMRFFIGNHLHLQGEALLDRKNYWLADFMVILLECTILGFLGSISPLDSKNVSSFGFAEVLIALYAVDIVWILVQYVQRRRRWTDEKHSWTWLRRWGLLNLCLLIFTLGLWWYVGNPYSPDALHGLAIVNGVIAFGIDITLSLKALLRAEEP